ncbi:type II secretion system protein [Candidatus Magnetominusculus xianensis]|uniref:Type II secretion system protein H n=1 Tax=Candidatus Magnetominusculus xianensis TaxID=1748249 RepID=A0ABR5SIA6_9BACT|nr:type II secretion system protein [Candidatus Magnetominusculus xianensis]KWT90988.1 type II secretion system protein H [Candidatus Magnetominusculus xianensis]MBF0403142.1 type II secretion system protein [Nitrospirota bacterium]
MRRQEGFTLIELLIVTALIAVVLAVAVPFSIHMYKRYASSLDAERLLILVTQIQREAFLTGQEIYIKAVDGILYANDVPWPIVDKSDEMNPNPPLSAYVSMERPVMFFNNGTTSGGNIDVYVKDIKFTVEIFAPLGNISMN